MKIQVLSDQHVDFKDNFSYFINRCHVRADTLIIAGDLHPHGFEREDFINKHILPKWKNTIIIPGNHEFYGSTCDDEYFGSKKTVYEHSNGNKCYYVNNDIVKINNISFVCSTLWSYISFENTLMLQNSMNDYIAISGNTVDKNNEVFLDNCKYLNEAIDSLSRCIMVTHHLPSYSLISDKYRGHALNEAFSADMDVFIMKNSHKIPVWICGHSHDYYDYYIDKTRCVRNPMGYPQERKSKYGCNMDLVLDVY